MPAKSATEVFWDNVYDSTSYSRELSGSVRRAVTRAHEFFGPLEGRTLLDVGCGTGATAVFWAQAGATVTAVDYSDTAIAALEQRCARLGLTNVTALVGDASTIDRLGTFDLVFGSMILHHLEPFRDFTRTLRGSVTTGGRAFFYENNAASSLLIWFRKHLVGRLWVPKHGDADEFPLTREEVDMLRELFTVRVEFPDMFFFQVAATYLFRGHFRRSMRAMDQFLYRHRIGVSRSYHQYVMLQADA